MQPPCSRTALPPPKGVRIRILRSNSIQCDQTYVESLGWLKNYSRLRPLPWRDVGPVGAVFAHGEMRQPLQELRASLVPTFRFGRQPSVPRPREGLFVDTESPRAPGSKAGCGPQAPGSSVQRQRVQQQCLLGCFAAAPGMEPLRGLIIGRRGRFPAPQPSKPMLFPRPL